MLLASVPVAEAPRVEVRALHGSAARFFALPPHTLMVMPALSPTMESGSLESWTKKVGDRIKEGDKLALVETDKATIDFDAVEEGFLAKILVPAGTRDVKVSGGGGVFFPVCSTAPKPAAAQPSGTAAAAPAAPQPSATSASAAPASSSPAQSGGRVLASPAAKKEAREAGIEVGSVSGSGPAGRVVLADVRTAKAAAPLAATAVAAGAPAPATPAAGSGTYEELPVSNIRRVTAARLSEAKRNVPHYYLSVDVVVDELLRVRQLLNSQNDIK